MIVGGFFGFTSFVYGDANIVVSILPQQTFVEKIGGEKVHVTTMVKPGSDPHTYEPKASQMRAISKAEVYFPINLEFENNWLSKFANQNKNMKFSDMTKGVELIKMDAHNHSHGHEHHHNHDSHNDAPFEWAGVFDLKKGNYTWSFSKVDGKYADPAMQFLMIQSKKNNHDIIEEYENQAIKLFNKGTVKLAKDEDFLNSNVGLYQLTFNASKDKTLFHLNIKKSGKYLFFTEHMPFEFEDKEHFFKDTAHNNIEPIATEPEQKEELDPHTWTAPQNVKIMAKNIYNTLVDIDSENKAYYKKNYEKFINEINQTDIKIQNIFSKIPKNSKFMVFHPSWGYFAKEYGLTQLSIEVEGKDPKAKMLKKIIEEARENEVKAIFTQHEFSDKSAKVLAAELNIKVLKETPLAKDWSNNLIKMANAIANNN